MSFLCSNVFFIYFGLTIVFQSFFAVVSDKISCPTNCSTTAKNNSHFEQLCSELGTKHDRCCFNNMSQKIIGLDLNSCELNSLSGLQDFPNLIFLFLKDNPDIKNCSKTDFVGQASLDYLFLPESCEKCPGGDAAWQSEKNNNCINQTNPCHYLNVTCASNSHCVHTGPGSAECLCLPGYHGYKCLNEGSFPLITFVVSLVIPAVAISIFLWFTQRRHVKME